MASPIGRVLLMDKGAYSGSTVYNQLDWVRDNGAAWVCKVDGTVGIAPPTLPTTSNANWTLMAADGSVSGSIDWSAVNNKPFDDINTTEFEKDASNNLRLKNPNNFGTIKVDTHLLYASCANDTIEFEAGNNVTITTDNVSNPNKITIAATGGGGGSSTFAGLSDVSLSGAPSAGQMIQYVNDGGNIKLQNVSPDASPTSSSIKPVTSGGVYSALSGKADTSELDNWITGNGSTTGVVISGSPNYFTFTGIDDTNNNGYKPFIQITDSSTNKNPTAQITSLSGAGTASMSITYSTDADVGSVVKLRRIK